MLQGMHDEQQGSYEALLYATAGCCLLQGCKAACQHQNLLGNSANAQSTRSLARITTHLATPQNSRFPAPTTPFPWQHPHLQVTSYWLAAAHDMHHCRPAIEAHCCWGCRGSTAVSRSPLLAANVVQKQGQSRLPCWLHGVHRLHKPLGQDDLSKCNPVHRHRHWPHMHATTDTRSTHSNRGRRQPPCAVWLDDTHTRGNTHPAHAQHLSCCVPSHCNVYTA